MHVSVGSLCLSVRRRALGALFVSGASATFMAHAADGSLAKVTAVQNTVEAKTAAGTTWAASKNGDPLKANDRVRTGPGSRAAILYSDQTLHRMNEKSEIEILPPASGGSGIVKILSGQSYFTTRTPKDFGRVQTPTVTAAIKGTEFAVSVGEDGTSVVTMIEGTVEASNEFGAVTVTKGEEAVAAPGKAPQRRVIVKPRDAVQWSLYFPPVLGGADAQRLQGSPLANAATQLSSGQVDAAKAAIADARSADPRNPVALALASVVALASDDRDQARSLADQAVAADGKSASALLARSYVAQADFDLDRAAKLAEQAAAADPQSAEAQARVAEMRLAMGDHAAARNAAEAAVSRQPGNARALTVLGFVQLAQFQTKDAASSFDKAVAADNGFPLAHAGRGIAQFRLGHLGTGKEELQTAATLDPAESLYRSYLGKAYYEDYQSKPAEKELAAAKSLDPHDPTPWLYDAILLQSENRPVEALQNLNTSMELNDQRAVYRSRLLLDEDTAVRSTDLARIYKDLGFEQLGLVAARRSADEDQANYSSHLFLAGNYRSLPGFASSFLSETLQARIYQPATVNAVRPDSQTGAVEFNEYTALFDRPRWQGYVSGSFGYTDTNLSSYFPNDPATESFFEINDSHNWSGAGTATYHNDRFSGEVSVSKTSDDGFRINNDQETTVYSGFFEGAVSAKDTVQLNAIVASRNNGDLPLREIPLLLSPFTFDTDELNFGLAWHRQIRRGTDLAVSAIWNDTDQTSTLIGTSLEGEAKLTGPQLEAQIVHRAGRVNFIGGIGGFDGTFEESSGGTSFQEDDQFANAYGYAKVHGLGPIDVVAGFAVESVDSPVGLLPPRDSVILPTNVKFTSTEVNPKVGASATWKSGTTIRAAMFSRLASGIGRLQTLEPTQVSGFNQFFEDVGGTHSTNYGIGFDQQLIRKVFFGASWLHRNLDIPEAFCPTPNSAGCTTQAGTVLTQRNANVDLFSAYANGLIGRWVAASFEYVLDDRNFDTTQVSPIGLFENYVRTSRYHPEARVFLPMGFYGVVGATYYAQRIQQFDDFLAPVYTTLTPRFWTMNAAIGYRLPDRLGLVTLEGTNLTDREFDVYQQALQEQVIPARRVVLKADFQF